ncbi:hypothetical protein CFC21_083800 [Triticum aestivum]|uniref:Uncharacterized protein n=2 Tax=Triticum aestivum TaxID=4565 RepID=A0A3B6NS44_WHEAT|nr:hypothetical protein CFC21_083800 [Triticum aestivum]
MSKPLLFTFPASLPSSTSLMADLTCGRCYAERSTGILLSPAVKRALWARHLALPVIRLVMGDGVDDLTRLATQRRRIWREAGDMRERGIDPFGYCTKFENGKKMLILHGTRTSAVLKFVLADVFHLMRDHYVKYANNKDNNKTFESKGPTSLEV